MPAGRRACLASVAGMLSAKLRVPGQRRAARKERSSAFRPRAVAVLEAPPPAADLSRMAVGHRPRVVVLGSGWGGYSFIKARAAPPAAAALRRARAMEVAGGERSGAACLRSRLTRVRRRHCASRRTRTSRSSASATSSWCGRCRAAPARLPRSRPLQQPPRTG